MSSILAAATLIPMSAGGSFRSDGAQLLEMLRSHSRGADDSALALRGLRIMSAAHPPAAWDPALVSLALGPQATPFDAVSARLFASWASLARSDVATASRWLDEAWGMVPELGTTPAAVAARSEIAIEMAVQCVAWKQDPAEGRAWQERAGDTHEESMAMALARAAIAAAEARADAAREQLARARRLRENSAFPLGTAAYAPTLARLEHAVASQ
jgi:hypothetical protein